MLDYVVIDGQRASIGEHAHFFPGYFGIDSMSLILGKNGSGKTRLLQTLAEVLTAGASLGDQGYWVSRDSHGQVQQRDTRHSPPGLGVVYYTPLSFQRPIRPNRNFVNASKIKAASLKQSMLTNFSNVAESLGASTELTASLSYHPSIFERLVIPTLLERRGQIRDSSLDEYLKKYTEFRMKAPSEETESMTKAFAHSLREWVESTLDSLHGPHYRIAVLATLQEFGKDLKDRLFVTTAILAELELVQFDTSYDTNRFGLRKIIDKFHSALNASLSIAMNGNARPTRHSGETVEIHFSVDDARQLQEIERSGSSFQLSWTNLSSGLLSLVDQFARLEVALNRLASQRKRSVLVLIDEGDSYLHLDWQRQYVEKLDQFLTSAKRRFEFQEVQALIATHSPIISGDFPSTLIQRVGSEMDQNIKTFGSSLDALVLEAFGTPSIGSKAAHQVLRLRENFLQENLSDFDLHLIDEIGDERLRYAVLAPQERQNDH